MNSFTLGMFCGVVVCGLVLTITTVLVQKERIENTCQGTPWVIEEPLIKKTITCVVELKENK